MKKCNNCGAVVEDNSNFCLKCGSNNLSVEAPVQQNGFQQNGFQQNGFQQNGFQTPAQQGFNQVNGGFQQPMNGQPQPSDDKNKKIIKILIAVIGVILVIALIAIGVSIGSSSGDSPSGGSDSGYVDQNDSEDKDSDDEDDEDASSDEDADSDEDEKETEKETEKAKVEYTKGEVIDGYYVNEWANIKFEITDEWPDTTATDGANYEDAKTETGFASVDSTQGKQLAIAFEDVSAYGDEITEEIYLDAYETNLSKGFDSSVEYEVSEKYTTIIAGETFHGVDVVITGAGGSVTLSTFVRLQDGKAILFAVSSMSESDIEDVLSSVETCD